MDATCPPGGWDSLWASGTRGGGALAAYAAWWRPGLNLLCRSIRRALGGGVLAGDEGARRRRADCAARPLPYKAGDTVVKRDLPLEILHYTR